MVCINCPLSLLCAWRQAGWSKNGPSLGERGGYVVGFSVPGSLFLSSYRLCKVRCLGDKTMPPSPETDVSSLNLMCASVLLKLYYKHNWSFFPISPSLKGENYSIKHEREIFYTICNTYASSGELHIISRSHGCHMLEPFWCSRDKRISEMWN